MSTNASLTLCSLKEGRFFSFISNNWLLFLSPLVSNCVNANIAFSSKDLGSLLSSSMLQSRKYLIFVKAAPPSCCPITHIGRGNSMSCFVATDAPIYQPLSRTDPLSSFIAAKRCQWKSTNTGSIERVLLSLLWKNLFMNCFILVEKPMSSLMTDITFPNQTFSVGSLRIKQISACFSCGKKSSSFRTGYNPLFFMRRFTSKTMFFQIQNANHGFLHLFFCLQCCWIWDDT